MLVCNPLLHHQQLYLPVNLQLWLLYSYGCSSVCLSACMSVCLPACMQTCLYACLKPSLTLPTGATSLSQRLARLCWPLSYTVYHRATESGNTLFPSFALPVLHTLLHFVSSLQLPLLQALLRFMSRWKKIAALPSLPVPISCSLQTLDSNFFSICDV